MASQIPAPPPVQTHCPLCRQPFDLAAGSTSPRRPGSSEDGVTICVSCSYEIERDQPYYGNGISGY